MSLEQSLVVTKMREYKGGAKVRGLAFDLSRDQVKALILGNCHYCGIEPCKEYRPQKGKWRGTVKWNGIDRIDNDQDYVEDNVVTACHACNHAKHVLTASVFEAWLERVTAFRQVQQQEDLDAAQRAATKSFVLSHPGWGWTREDEKS